jgi:hypothetical protein
MLQVRASRLVELEGATSSSGSNAIAASGWSYFSNP